MDEAYKLSDGYRNWAAFVEEFRTIEESLQESKQVERMLIGRCNQLKSELVASAKKLHTVMSVRAEDERTMALLRKECDRSVVTSMDAQLKEKQAMALVSGLQADIEALQTQVGVLQSALWLERERANAAVNASRSIGKNTSKSALLRLNTTSPASVAAAEAAAAAAGALAASSTGSGGASGSPAARKHGFPAKRTGGGLGGRAIRLASSRRPATAATTATAQGRHKARGRLQAGVGTGLYGESSSEFWGGGGGGGGQAGNNEIEARDFEAGVFEAGGNSMSGTVLTDASLGLGSWKTHGIDTFFHGRGRVGRGGGHLGPGQEAATGGYVLDLDGRRGYAHAGGGGPAGEEGSGGGGEAITPFQRWKKSRGIVSPGVAEVFAGQGCFL